MEAIDNPLHEASKRGNLPFLHECLANGVSVNGLDKSGATPVYWAAHGGHSACVEALLAVQNISIDSQVLPSSRHVIFFTPSMVIDYQYDVSMVNAQRDKVPDGKKELALLLNSWEHITHANKKI